MLHVLVSTGVFPPSLFSYPLRRCYFFFFAIAILPVSCLFSSFLQDEWTN
jgi:hypothetical protein